jgi:hypothetical protein
MEFLEGVSRLVPDDKRNEGKKTQPYPGEKSMRG